MKKTIITIAVIVVLLLIVMLLGPFYILQEGEQRPGKPGRGDRHHMAPPVQDVQRLLHMGKQFRCRRFAAFIENGPVHRSAVQAVFRGKGRNQLRKSLLEGKADGRRNFRLSGHRKAQPAHRRLHGIDNRRPGIAQGAVKVKDNQSRHRLQR